MRMYYHQALFNKQIADYQTSMLVAAENQREVEVSRLQTQLSETALELSSCVGANRALEAKGATLEAKLAKAQHEANAARLCFANLREEVKSHGLPDPGHIRQYQARCLEEMEREEEPAAEAPSVYAAGTSPFA